MKSHKSCSGCIRVLLVCLVGVGSGCLSFNPNSGSGGPEPKVFDGVMLKPNITASSARLKPRVPLTVVVAAGIRDDLTLSRAQGTVVVKVANFRTAIEDGLKTTFADNFTAVTVSAAETQKGLELVVLDAAIPTENDALQFHFVFTSDGKDIYEFKSQIQPTPKSMGADVFTYHKVVRDLTVENLEYDVKELAATIAGKVLINNDLNKFWDEWSKKGVK